MCELPGGGVRVITVFLRLTGEQETQQWNAQMCFVQQYRKADHEHQPGRESQQIRMNMWRNPCTEEQCQRMMHQVDKQGRVNKVTDPRRLEIKHPVAE